VGVTACIKEIAGSPYHAVGDKYLRALVDCAEVTPLVIPAMGEILDLPSLVGQLDGLMLTGSPSNVHPARYGAAPSPEAEPHDLARDATSFPLIDQALRQGLPLLAICRGFQELNAALGGTLEPQVRTLPGRLDHRRVQNPDPDVQYGPNHPVQLEPDSLIARIAGRDSMMINSLHNQAIAHLAPGLVVEGVAPDGTIEAVRVGGASAFALGVQWHPEYNAKQQDFARRLFAAFGAAAQARAADRSG
jgi:putative glutamine amidotransferase|tara:strand:- start:3002 stop:3742 length:741 start_codon:yes stop_codon:yes gene_type:complete